MITFAPMTTRSKRKHARALRRLVGSAFVVLVCCCVQVGASAKKPDVNAGVGAYAARPETHALIRELGRERAVLLSTHILSDVEALAGRVVILHGGRVRADGTPAALRERLGAASLDEVFAKVTAKVQAS